MNCKAIYISATILSSFIFFSCKKEIIKSVPKTDSTSIKTEALKADSTVLNPNDSLYGLVDKSVIGTQFLTKSSLAPRLKNY